MYNVHISDYLKHDSRTKWFFPLGSERSAGAGPVPGQEPDQDQQQERKDVN